MKCLKRWIIILIIIISFFKIFISFQINIKFKSFLKFQIYTTTFFSLIYFLLFLSPSYGELVNSNYNYHFWELIFDIDETFKPNHKHRSHYLWLLVASISLFLAYFMLTKLSVTILCIYPSNTTYEFLQFISLISLFLVSLEVDFIVSYLFFYIWNFRCHFHDLSPRYGKI